MAAEWIDEKAEDKKKKKALKAKAEKGRAGGSGSSESDSESDGTFKPKNKKARTKGPLFQVKWLRIVLGTSCCECSSPLTDAPSYFLAILRHSAVALPATDTQTKRKTSKTKTRKPRAQRARSRRNIAGA
jgi:hypothetical protein